MKKRPDQNLTKGKMVLELVKYAKSAVKNFDQSEASFKSHTNPTNFIIDASKERSIRVNFENQIFKADGT